VAVLTRHTEDDVARVTWQVTECTVLTCGPIGERHVDQLEAATWHPGFSQ
jgi:hypothetical protein